MMDLVEDLTDPTVSVVQACAALGVSRATLYRSTTLPATPSCRERAASPRRLSVAERTEILALFHDKEFVDQPPAEVYATLLSRGVYLASPRTMYRLLAELGETKERRNQRQPHTYAKPSLTATRPNQVWTWDITKLATNAVGVFLHAYVIIDLYSRFVVGWLVAVKESKDLARQLFAETLARHDVAPGLTVHADRGSAMRSDTLAQLLATLGVERSFSRPHVSDDNAFSESHFKTMKYQPDYPGRFQGELHARGWLASFFGWHNEEHHHSGLALFTPADVFTGRVEEVRSKRQDALDRAYRAHPERFPNGPPRVPLPPSEVSINPITSSTLALPQPTAASPNPELDLEAGAPDGSKVAHRLLAPASGTSQHADTTITSTKTSPGVFPPIVSSGSEVRQRALPS
jgi:transposase InsO family protein